MHVQFRLLLFAMVVSAIVETPAFTAPALSAKPVQEVVVETGQLGIDDETEDYDPWEPFNEKMFAFNCAIDIYVLRPLATGYNGIVLEGEKDAIHNMLENVAMPKRFIHSLLQGKFEGAGRELARFLINTTFGLAGMADVAKYQFHIQESDEDGGKTLTYYGVGPGPYLVVPFLSPLTVRDGFGYILSIDPINFFMPVLAVFGKATENAVNERAITLRDEGKADLRFDDYSAIRHAYLTRPDHRIGFLLTTVSREP
jgi:phospholipid-binding lipoprotein MlaA